LEFERAATLSFAGALDDPLQEINYLAIASALREVGYSGWVGHEFIPQAGRDIEEALAAAVALFN
jgi:hydroxypyruvate isomerase